MSEWISVRERLPEEWPESVLAYYSGGVHEVFLFRGKWYQADMEYEALGLTHWMPMPEPPGEEE